MDKADLRQWICDMYIVPDDNITLAPNMLDGILDYAEGMEPEERYHFFRTVLPDLPESIIRSVDY